MANRERKVRLGFIGCGMVSRVGHGPAAAADSRAVLAACADPDDGNRGRFAKRYKIAAAFRDHRDMLERARLDAVVIASPPWLHAEHVEDCAARGLAILCEKPLAGTIEDCDRIVAAGNNYPVLLLIGHSKRLEVGFQRIKEWISAGRLGRVH